MTTLGWVFILCAGLLLRAVSKGRVMNIGEDLSDAFLAVVSGDTAKAGEVLSRTGDSNTVDQADIITGVGKKVVKTADGIKDVSQSLAMVSMRLGEAAKGYEWTATGPDYYDCSGLIWAACRELGYKGSRFTTATVRGRKSAFMEISPPKTSGPNVEAAGYDDIVLWLAGQGGLTGHMGVITGADKFYSALSKRSGIKEVSISQFRKGTRPIYLRYIGPRDGN